MTGEKIRILRERAGMDQKALAVRLNVSRTSINLWERGIVTPSTQCIVKLAEFFCVSCDELLCKESPPCLNMEGLSEGDICAIARLVERFRNR